MCFPCTRCWVCADLDPVSSKVGVEREGGGGGGELIFNAQSTMIFVSGWNTVYQNAINTRNIYMLKLAYCELESRFLLFWVKVRERLAEKGSSNLSLAWTDGRHWPCHQQGRHAISASHRSSIKGLQCFSGGRSHHGQTGAPAGESDLLAFSVGLIRRVCVFLSCFVLIFLTLHFSHERTFG